MSRRLSVLLDAGLIRRRRAGRCVLCYRTGAGQMLVAAQPRPVSTGAGGPAVSTGRGICAFSAEPAAE